MSFLSRIEFLNTSETDKSNTICFVGAVLFTIVLTAVRKCILSTPSSSTISLFRSCRPRVEGKEFDLTFSFILEFKSLFYITMATTTVETVYVPHNVDEKSLENHRWRLRIWMCSGVSMLIVLSTALALIMLILNFSTFLSQTYDLAEGDMRLISISTAFCEEISLGKGSSKRKLWIMPSLRLSPQLRRTNSSTEVLVSKFKYWYKGFYLLDGSSVIINAESDSPLKLFIFKDRKRLDEWLDQNGENSMERSGFTAGDSDFSSQPSRISYTLSVHETGNYFILFKYARGKKDFARMKLDLIVDRKVYDLDSSVFSCSAAAKETCSARLLFGSSEVGVIEVTDDPYYLSNELVSTWRCEPRIWFYLAVFVGPILFSIIASFVFYFVFINRKRDRHIQKLAIQRQQTLRRASGAGCNRSNSFANNRSLNGSLRRSPSRTSSTRACSPDMSRVTCLQPVVTTMYSGHSISEDSGHDTDDDNINRVNNSTRHQKRTSSVDGASLASRESISRRPSFSTFQGSEDESCNATREVAKVEVVPSRNRSGRVRDNSDAGRRSSDDRARKASFKARSDRHEMRDKIPNGTVPRNSPTRRYSSDELYDRAIKTLPRNRGNTAPDALGRQFAPELHPPPGRPASLPSLQCPDGAWGLPSDLVPDCRPRISAFSRDADFRQPQEESTIEPQEIKLRTHSGRRRDMGWAPRLSMVSEV